MAWGVDDDRTWGGPGDSDRLWLYFMMPFMSATVGWLTNVLALKMTFYPLEFIGIKLWQPKNQPLGLFGWQGILPAKAAVMASKSVKLLTQELDVNAVFSNINPDEFAQQMGPGILVMMDEIVRKVARRHLPLGMWDKIPEDVQIEIIIKTVDDAPSILSKVLMKVKDNIEDVLDLEHMVVTAMVANKQLMIDIFIAVGTKEIIFIERSGFVLGFLFGIIQAVIWYFYQENEWIVFYVGGFIVGFATNWIALKIIFLPIGEYNICGFKIQGLFLKRQDEVSRVFAQQNASKVLTPTAFWHAILTGPNKDNFNDLLEESISSFLDKMLGHLETSVNRYFGKTEYQNVKDDITQLIIAALPAHVHHSYNYMEKALDLETNLREKMQALTKAKFERVLHPVFEEDELKLIIVGAVLGFLVGVFQNAVMFV